MAEWFACTGEEVSSKQGLVGEVLCGLPPKLTHRVAEVLNNRQAATEAKRNDCHGDDLTTFPALSKGEDVTSRQRRLKGLRTAATQLETSFQTFCRDRDRDDFQRLWLTCLAPYSPQRLLAGSQPAQSQCPSSGTAPASGTGPLPSGIPTLLLSTNGASMADRLDLYGSFASYLRERQDAYVALLRPEDLAGGVGGCFNAALAQLSGLPEAAAEDVEGLVAWYEQETGRGNALAPTQAPPQKTDVVCAGGGAAVPVTPGKKAAAGTAAKTPGKGGAKGAAAKTPGKRGGGGGRGGAKHDAEGEGEEKENAGGEEQAEGAAEGTVAMRLRARRGQAGQAAAVVAEAEAQRARQAAAAAAARNQRRHVVLMVEGAGRVADRGVLRALLAALHGERHRLPVVLVLGLSCPAALYVSKLPADVASLLQMTAADLAPHPQQLHRFFQEVLLAECGPSSSASPSSSSASALLLLDGAAMRELLVQARLLEPSLAHLQAALLEAHEQHFRHEPLSWLALLPLSGCPEEQQSQQQQQQPPSLHVIPDSSDDEEGDEEGKAQGGRSRGGRSRRSSSSSSYVSVQSCREDQESKGQEDGEGGGELAGRCGDEAGVLERRRRQHQERLAVAVADLPKDLLRTAAAAMGAAAGAGGQHAGGGEAEVVCSAVAEAFGALSSWRLGMQWMALLAERTGALQQPGGQRYTLPSLYVAAASPAFWKPHAAAPAVAAAAGGAARAPGGPYVGGPTTSLAAVLIAGVLGPTAACGAGATAAAAGRPAGGRGTLKAMQEEDLVSVLDELQEAAREALLRGWMPSGAVLGAVQGLADLRNVYHKERAAQAMEAGLGSGAGAGGSGADQKDDDDDETSPVRRRLAAQGLTSPPTAQKLQGLTDRLGRIGNPLPAPKLLQPNDEAEAGQAEAPTQQQQGQAQAAVKKPTGVKLPSSGQTQNKRDRAKALLTAVQQRAAAGPSLQPDGADATAAGPSASAGSRPAPLADRAAELLAQSLKDLLATCPFGLPGSSVFTFRDAAGLQRRLVGAPSLALHTALTQPELALRDLQPGLHPGQEDAAIAYQLLVGCKDGVDLREWLADFCAASGLGRLQDVPMEDEEAEDAEDGAADGKGQEDGPMGRSRRSKRRNAPRKRKAAPKQEVVLALDGPEAEAAVDALACRFEQVARELEAVGLCRFSKRRKGLYVNRTYFPPEAIA